MRKFWTHTALGLAVLGGALAPLSICRGDAAPNAVEARVITDAKKFAHESSDLKPDSRAIFGKLDNGLRYVILPTKAAPTRASLRLYMDVGTLHEADDQQGMAHFLEHLMFTGTKNFPGNKTVEYFQRLGLRFGADTNAFTTYDRTTLYLDIPPIL